MPVPIDKVYLSISSTGVTANLRIKGSERFIKNLLASTFWQSFIPSAQLSQIPKNDSYHIDITEADRWSLHAEGGHQVIGAASHNVQDVIVVTGYLLEELRQAAGAYTIHGSAISDGRGAIGLIGGISGIGKTSLAVYMADNGWRHIGDEKFVVDRTGRIISGVCVPMVKTDASLPQLEAFEPLPIKAFVFPIIANTKDLIEHIYDTNKTTWHLYEEMTRDIRLTSGLVNEFSSTLPSNDTDELALQRLKLARKFANEVPVMFLQGSLQAVSNKLSDLR